MYVCMLGPSPWTLNPRRRTQLPKSIPDYESAGAAWAYVNELGVGREGERQEGSLRLRGGEPVKWFNYIGEGGAVYPMSLLEDYGSK